VLGVYFRGLRGWEFGDWGSGSTHTFPERCHFYCCSMEKGEARQMRFPLSICFGKVKYGEGVKRGVS